MKSREEVRGRFTDSVVVIQVDEEYRDAEP